MQNLLRRSFSGLVYVLLFLGAIMFSQESYLLLVAIFGVICIWEFSKMIDSKGFLSYLLFPLVLFLMIKRQGNSSVLFLLIINVLSSSFLVYQLFAKKEFIHNKQISKFGLNLRYIVFSICFLALLPFYENQFHPYLIIAVLSIIWVNDSFAFLVGKNFGKRKLFVSVSPKKTVEGFIGGVFFSLIAAFIISKLNTDFLLMHWLVIALIVAILGTIGDLVESKFKRQANIKDSGNIMPGHGGILDRLDSLMFAAPFVYLYINFII